MPPPAERSELVPQVVRDALDGERLHNRRLRARWLWRKGIGEVGLSVRERIEGARVSTLGEGRPHRDDDSRCVRLGQAHAPGLGLHEAHELHRDVSVQLAGHPYVSVNEVVNPVKDVARKLQGCEPVESLLHGTGRIESVLLVNDLVAAQESNS